MNYRIDLTSYGVEEERWSIVEGERKLVKSVTPLDVNAELYAILRIPGVYKDGVETCDGIDLAKRIKEAKDDYIDIEPDELELLKRIFNKLIAQEHKPQTGQMAMGGDRYIPLIQRIFKAEEVA